MTNKTLVGLISSGIIVGGFVAWLNKFSYDLMIQESEEWKKDEFSKKANEYRKRSFMREDLNGLKSVEAKVFDYVLFRFGREVAFYTLKYKTKN